MVQSRCIATFNLNTMKFRLLIIIAFFSVMAFISQAQNEIHFTQFEMAPIQLNPALSGNFQGTYRVGGIYRDQWFSVIDNSFKTADLYVDVNVIRGIRKQDWVSVGLGYSAIDQAGTFGQSEEGGSRGLKNSFFNMGAAYHLANKKRTNIFSIGVQRSSVSSTFNLLVPSDARSGLQAVPNSIDVDAFNAMPNMDQQLDGSFSDWEIGLVFNRRGKDSNLKIGVSGSRMFSPKFNIGNLRTEIDPLIAVFAEYKMGMGDGLYIKPSVLYMTQGPASEIVLQGRVGRQMNDDLSINAGLGLRMGDAVQILLGADFKQYKIGVSYDVNMSGLTAASSTVGGFELALAYVGSINKKPKLKPIIICPRL